jgi:hypothetical protein
LSNKMAGLTTEGTAQRIQRCCHLCKGKCWPNLNIIPACRTRRFCGQLSTTSRDCDHNGHSQFASAASASAASDRKLHAVNSFRTWIYYPIVPFRSQLQIA